MSCARLRLCRAAWIGIASVTLSGGVANAVAPSDREIAQLTHEVERLEAARAIKHLQRAYGYYMDRALSREAADLFAPDATLEVGSDGVFSGREQIAGYLARLEKGGNGLPWGILADHYQLQPVVHVSADGLMAKARWRDFGFLGEYGKSATWEEGVFENTYVKRDGVWMIQSLHLYVDFEAPYEKGWARTGFRTEVVPFHYKNPSADTPSLASSWKRIRALQSHDEIENLQGIFGYYFDKNLWSDVAALFTSDATFEYGQQGVYVGRARIAQALKLFGPAGPVPGYMNNAFQLQPVIHVDDSGTTAKGRWECIMQLARPNSSGAWGLGVYENEYRLEGGRWKISKLHWYVTAMADYDLMWAKGTLPMAGPSAVLPPDRPPSEIYRSLPGVYIPPFHYRHPVTGQPIRTEPQPVDSIVRPKS